MLCEAIKETLSTKRMNLNYANITRSVFRFHRILKIDSQVNKILLKIEKINAPPPPPPNYTQEVYYKTPTKFFSWRVSS